MMGRWIRVDVTRQQHPRALIAGGWGGVVVEAVWEIVKSRDSDGTLPAIFWNPEYLTAWTHFDSERGGLAGIKRGMKKAVEAGLVEVLDDGSVLIHDWQQYQVDPRAGKKRPDPYKNAKLKPPDPGPSRTSRDDTGLSGPIRRTGHDNTGQGGPAPDYSKTHPAVAPDPVETSPDLTWVVQEAFRNQYAEQYGHRSRWSEPGHGQKAADLVDYFRELAEGKGLDLDADTLARGVKNATKRYLSDGDEFVIAAAHNFDLFVSRIDRYVGVQK